MSVFKELNNVRLDLSEFEEIVLTKHEQKRILKKVNKEISLSQHKKKWLGMSIAGVAVCLLSLSLIIDKGTIASMPLVGGVIEKYINANENLDYSSYKTAIGETAENKLGKLTLNEVMMDDRQLFLSATFEPAENVEFNYQTHIFPTVKINGETYTVTTGGQSIELNDEMFSIYNDIDLSQAIKTENVNIEISYNKWNFDTAIEQPWTFSVEVPQTELLAKKNVIEMNQVLKLDSGDTVKIEKVVSTPISTTVYYDLSQSNREDVYFKIQSEDGKMVIFSSAYTSNERGEISVARFNGFTLKDNQYYLIPYDFDGEQLSREPIPIK